MNVAMRLLEKKKELPKKEKFLKKSLLEAQKNLTDAYAGLDSVQEPDLIDSYIYQLNAAYLRYRVLLRDETALTTDEVHQTPRQGQTAAAYQVEQLHNNQNSLPAGILW